MEVHYLDDLEYIIEKDLVYFKPNLDVTKYISYQSYHIRRKEDPICKCLFLSRKFFQNCLNDIHIYIH